MALLQEQFMLNMKMRKHARLRGELKQCVPKSVQTNTFPLAKKDNVRVERKQYALVTAHTLTIYKAQ